MKLRQKLATGMLLGAIASSLAFTTANAFAAERSKGRFDTNGDSAIDLTEATAAATAKAEKHLIKLDTDLDSLVSLDEYLADERASRDLTTYAEDIVECVSQMKEDSGDDTINIPNVSDFTSPEQRFSTTDTSSDSYIDLAEAIERSVSKATANFTAQDANADGLVTKEESKAYRSNNKSTRQAVKTCINDVTTEAAF